MEPAVLLFVALLLINLTSWLIQRSQAGAVQLHKAQLAREVASLRRQAELVNTPSTYAKCAKMQRLANAKAQELALIQGDGGGGVRSRVAAAFSALKVLLIGLSVLMLWGRPLLYIPPRLTLPFSKLLLFPHRSPPLQLGSVTVLPWVALCDRVSLLAARTLLPLRTPKLGAQALHTVQEEKEL